MKQITILLLLVTICSSCAQWKQLSDRRYLVEQCVSRLTQAVGPEIAAFRCSVFYGYEEAEKGALDLKQLMEEI